MTFSYNGVKALPLQKSGNVLKNRGFANQPKMDNFENFSIIYSSKSKLKGGQFFEKHVNSCILGPILCTVLDIVGEGGGGRGDGSANKPSIVQL